MDPIIFDSTPSSLIRHFSPGICVGKVVSLKAKDIVLRNQILEYALPFFNDKVLLPVLAGSSCWWMLTVILFYLGITTSGLFAICQISSVYRTPVNREVFVGFHSLLLRGYIFVAVRNHGWPKFFHTRL